MKKPIIEVKKRKLPPSLQKFLDPRNHLDRKSFVPEGLEEMTSATVLFAGSVLFTVIVGGITLKEAWRFYTHQPIDPSKLYGGLLVTVICLIAAIVFTLKFLKGRKNQKAYDAGDHRAGVYVQPNGMLFYDGVLCTWLPRAAIVDIAHRKVGGKGETRIEAWVVIRNEDNREDSVWLPDCISNRVGQLTQWVKTGNFP